MTNFNSHGTYLSCGGLRTLTAKKKPTFEPVSLGRTWYYNADSTGKVPHHVGSNDIGPGLRG